MGSRGGAGRLDPCRVHRGDATTLTTDDVAIGKHNEYRFEVSDGSETVWTTDDFAICPLLSKGTRTVLGCTPTAAWEYLTADSATPTLPPCRK